MAVRKLTVEGKKPWLTLILILVFLGSIAQAQEDKEEKSLPAGMEKMKVGRTTEFIVPVGTKTSKKGDLVVLESPSEYVARRLAEMEERLSKIEAQEQELKARIAKLETDLDQMKKKGPQPPEKKNK